MAISPIWDIVLRITMVNSFNLKGRSGARANKNSQAVLSQIFVRTWLFFCFFFFFPPFLIRQITVVFEIGILWNNKMNIRII